MVDSSRLTGCVEVIERLRLVSQAGNSMLYHDSVGGQMDASWRAYVTVVSGREALKYLLHFSLAWRVACRPDCERRDGASLKNAAQGGDRRGGPGVHSELA